MRAMRLGGILPTPLAFGAVMLASSSLNNLFVTFYLELFAGVSRLPPWLFLGGQTVYLIWNATNDPVFGWLQDAARTGRGQVLRWGGVLWALAFVLVWFPPSVDSSEAWRAVHFVVSTCTYDAMLTLVEIAHSAMLAEITDDDGERAAFNGYAAAFAGLGSLTSFVGQWYWDTRDLTRFRLACLGIAGVCVLIFLGSSHVLEEAMMRRRREQQQQHKMAGAPVDPSSSSAGLRGVAVFFRQLTKQRNFFVYVGVASTQSFDCSFEKSSFVMFLAALAGDALTKSEKALVVSASFFLPWLITLGLTPVIQRLGVYRVLGGIFLARVIVCSLALVLFVLYGLRSNNTYATFTIVFLLLNRVMSESVCRVSPLVISDLVDEDRYIHKRNGQESRSGTIVGSVNFFTKLTQSLGPVVGYFILSSTAAAAAAGSAVAPWRIRLDLGLCIVPLCCAVTQFTLWASRFSLHGTRLKKVKEYLAEGGGGGGGGGGVDV